MSKSAKDVSIEYAHIYTNNKIGEEHTLSLDILGGLTKEQKENNRTVSLVVMVDDYSFPDPSFDYNEFAKWLSENGFAPDIMIRESELIPLCDEVLSLIRNEKIKEQLTKYIDTKKYPCSLFIATWYLLRLGHITSAIFDERFIASDLINILPLSFKPLEDKALEIIGATRFSEAVPHISHKYFEGRVVEQ